MRVMPPNGGSAGDLLTSDGDDVRLSNQDSGCLFSVITMLEANSTRLPCASAGSDGILI